MWAIHSYLKACNFLVKAQIKLVNLQDICDLCLQVLIFPFHYFNTSHKFLQSEFCMTLVLSCVEVQDIKWLGLIDPFATLALSLTTVFSYQRSLSFFFSLLAQK